MSELRPTRPKSAGSRADDPTTTRLDVASATPTVLHAMDLRWEDRQRAFQAKVLTEGIGDDIAIGVRPYRTFLGAAVGAPPPPAGSRRRTGG